MTLTFICFVFAIVVFAVLSYKQAQLNKEIRDLRDRIYDKDSS